MDTSQFVWSEDCMLEAIGENCCFSGFNISITCKDGKYGLMYHECIHANHDDTGTIIDHVLIPEQYETLYNLNNGESSGYFVAYSGAKCGLIEIRCYADTEEILDCRTVIPFKYDSFAWENSGDVFICYQGENAGYFNTKTKYLSPLYKSIFYHAGFLTCYRMADSIIIDTITDQIILTSTEKSHIEYACKYCDGVVFAENPTGSTWGNGTETKESARLCFYDTNTYSVITTAVYDELWIDVKKTELQEYLTGIEFVEASKHKRILADGRFFSNEDVLRLLSPPKKDNHIN